jgi:hypothetical protein
MDFSLLQADDNFRLENYFDAIIAEFKAIGREITITRKEKKMVFDIEKSGYQANQRSSTTHGR